MKAQASLNANYGHEVSNFCQARSLHVKLNPTRELTVLKTLIKISRNLESVKVNAVVQS